MLSYVRLIESMIPVRMINFPQVLTNLDPGPVFFFFFTICVICFLPVLNVVQGSDYVCCLAEGRRRAVRSSDAGFHPGGDSAAWNENIWNCYSEKTVTHRNKSVE